MSHEICLLMYFDSKGSYEAEANKSSVMDEGVAGSTREESADFKGDVDGVSVGADEDERSDNFGEAKLSSVLEDGAGGSAREEIADGVVGFQEENEEPWGEVTLTLENLYERIYIYAILVEEIPGVRVILYLYQTCILIRSLPAASIIFGDMAAVALFLLLFFFFLANPRSCLDRYRLALDLPSH